MECPKCRCEMEKVDYQGIEVDRCTECRGIWFDILEHEDLRKRPGSEAVDDGSAALGRKRNQEGAIDCPVCHTRMVRMVDARQPHIWYEGCSVCYGVFFDAGEFRDLKHHSLLDAVRDLFTGERR